MLIDVFWHLHHCSAPLHHWTVKGSPPQASPIHPITHSHLKKNYEFETSVRWVVNSTQISSPCRGDLPEDLTQADRSPQAPSTDCEGESNLSMWIYVLLGNVLRGIGETPVQPLGISYIDDFATEENAALYVGCVQTISVVGPVFGYLLGSLCAKIYVDIGFVNMENISDTKSIMKTKDHSRQVKDEV
ncbi:hypothetical protein ATANTOWER_016046 [Ataeniobius toweri]|uniref:Major facilitator superfamily (MFS) profile domain-containing protein n=1 Tax=Ataeniobius toweri TaxID=208326 RepID=A0ABU7BZL1_9TELE|nr:hypothetical protein [Ataeniobius toweri]